MTTVVQDGQGNVRARRMGSGATGRGSAAAMQQETTSYLDPTTGQRIVIRKRQKGDTIIEDKLLPNNRIVERTINGVPVPLPEDMTHPTVASD